MRMEKKFCVLIYQKEGVSTIADWIVNYLPPITFNIDHAENVRKSIEATCLYKLICLATVIADFKENILYQLRNYDFISMASKR